jgi:site-specific DNA recombinase
VPLQEDVVEALQGDPMRKALVQVQGIFAELEKSLLVRKLQKARHSTGRLGGRPPVYPKELKRRIRLLRSKGKTYGQIAERLNGEDIRTTTGKPWTPQLCRVLGC